MDRVLERPAREHEPQRCRATPVAVCPDRLALSHSRR
jgi:hypothetical protein